ncbi:hypothetical protein DFP72DRAFT_1074619 [Ephemerocybe angulata]|uniref:Uncharacterized protein n=1 Tax=Ephemerocybe angulata TaxID=980116 RepID=A0A8H6HJF8_9AGAR|nr:hypothetical protein DFP72DRAFT_1074619 [Tulosesus angulatus]
MTSCSPLAEHCDDIVPAPYSQHRHRLPARLSLAEQKISSPEEARFASYQHPMATSCQQHDHSFDHNIASMTHLTYDWLSHCHLVFRTSKNIIFPISVASTVQPASPQHHVVHTTFGSLQAHFPDLQKYQFHIMQLSPALYSVTRRARGESIHIYFVTQHVISPV